MGQREKESYGGVWLHGHMVEDSKQPREPNQYLMSLPPGHQHIIRPRKYLLVDLSMLQSTKILLVHPKYKMIFLCTIVHR